MKKINILFTISLAVVTLASCEEWQPVGTVKYGDVEVPAPWDLEANCDISDLKALYDGKPVMIEDDIVISGKVISEDRTGNIYKSLYIQDETGGIEIKTGRTGMYNDYKIGQRIYVACDGLTLGAYHGMLQLGMAYAAVEDEDPEYETSYMDLQYIVNSHVFKGEIEEPWEPVVFTENDKTTINNEANYGRYVTIRGLKYGCNPENDNYSDATKKIFTILYPEANTSETNRVFLSTGTFGVTTWAMSKEKFKEYLKKGNFNSASTSGGLGMNDVFPKTGRLLKDQLLYNASAYTVNQYFVLGGTTDVQIRTSGYCRFADTEIDPEVLDGTASVDVTGILTVYDGGLQLTFIDLESGLKVNK